MNGCSNVSRVHNTNRAICLRTHIHLTEHNQPQTRWEMKKICLRNSGDKNLKKKETDDSLR